MTEPLALPPHHPWCLACGPENPGSLGLKLEIDGDRVRGQVTLDRRHQGAPGFAHGGAVATALDDTLGTLLVVLGHPGVTARLEVDYRRPALLEHPFDTEAWVERVDGRKMYMAAALRADGETVAEARALFIKVDPEHFLKGGEVPDAWRKHWWREGAQLPY